MEEQAALHRGGRHWLDAQSTPPRHSLAHCDRILGEFVFDLDLPGRTPEWISKGSGTECVWRCPAGHYYVLSVDRRTGPQAVGCKKCGHDKISLARRKPPPGGSAAELAPDLVAEFRRNLTSPGRDLAQVRPKSHDICQWRCSTCPRTWFSTVKNRYTSHHSNCRNCNLKKAWQLRRQSEDGFLAERRQAGLDALSAFVLEYEHARVPADYVSPSGYRLASWVHQQRKAQGAMPARHRQKLEQFEGWSWGVRADAWENAFGKLEQFADREGHANAPYEHIEDGYYLGHFVSRTRRQRKLGQLSEERVARVGNLDGWQWHVYQPRTTRSTES